MLESIKDFWYLWLIVLILIVIIIPVCIKVSRSVQKRSEANEKIKKEFERIKMLKEKYKVVDKDKAQTADAKELCGGIAAVLQYELEKSQIPDDDFANAEKWRREVYALYWFDEDVTAESLSFFFRNNGGPLPSVAVNGLKSIGADKIYSTVAQMYSMYDDKNESVSLDKAKVEELDKKFSDIYDREAYFELVRKYIIDNL